MVLSIFSEASYIPPDPVFELTKDYLADQDPQKVNLGQGTYRDNNGNPWILPSVQLAKEKIFSTNHEYLPIAGLQGLRDSAVELVFDGDSAYKEGRIASCQSVSGTGALLLAGLLLRKLPKCPERVYITDPTWSNHELLFESLGFNVQKIPYYGADGFDFTTYLGTLKAIPQGSAVVLHACAHNPTGCDPTRDQWRAISEVVKERDLFPIIDAAYLGFNSGSVQEDKWMIWHFTEEAKLPSAVCMSFAKSMGLYGERVGVVAVVTDSKEEARNVQSLLENVQRATVSNPPAFGARLAAAVLGDADIRAQWERDLIEMSGRIRHMRQGLYERLVALQTPGDWTHIIKQTGMFGYLGLTPTQVQVLKKEYHVYMTSTSRISIAGLNEGNIDYFAKSLDSVVRQVK